VFARVKLNNAPLRLDLAQVADRVDLVDEDLHGLGLISIVRGRLPLVERRDTARSARSQ
jgi:hypothetical protein